MLHRHGIAVNGFFFNTPYDSRETIIKMSEFLAASDIGLVNHTILTLLPGAKLFDKTKAVFCRPDFPKDWERFDFSQLAFNPARMSMEEFYRLRHEMVLKTHSLKRILRQTARGLFHSKSLLMALLIFGSHLAQKNCHKRELVRNCQELQQLNKHQI